MMTKYKIASLMEKTGVRFGTSGVRDLNTTLTDKVCYIYTMAFIKYLEQKRDITKKGINIAIAGDHRPSTPRIMTAIAKAIIDSGYKVINCGKIPTPAVTFYGITNKIPSIMITGSHIPYDRNGIKFVQSVGEILKSDEAAIQNIEIEIDENLFDQNGMFASDQSANLSAEIPDGRDLFIKRYLDVFKKDSLKGKKIGLYGHSAVGRDLIYQILASLGAEVTKLRFTDEFVPIDTEAIREEDKVQAKKWSDEYHFDAIVTTDGDSDRPLLSDENGNWQRGDVVCILCADFLNANGVVPTVSCNTAVEKSNLFDKVIRSKIGSPYVLEEMINLSKEGYKIVVGYEANGGFMINSDIVINGKTLKALATRDATILILCILTQSVLEKKKISQLVSYLPQRATASSKVNEFPTETSIKIVTEMIEHKYDQIITKEFGGIEELNTIDGARYILKNGNIIHFRPSGNAPEFRCYSEADAPEAAQKLNDLGIALIEKWKHNS